MKQLFTSLAILFITCSALAQEKSKFQSAMEGSLQKMEKAKTPEEYQSVANTLARIAENEKERSSSRSLLQSRAQLAGVQPEGFGSGGRLKTTPIGTAEISRNISSLRFQ